MFFLSILGRETHAKVEIELFKHSEGDPAARWSLRDEEGG